MNQDRRSFPVTVHAYLWLALIVWCGLPLWFNVVGVIRDTAPMTSVYLGAFASFAIAVALRFVGTRCGGDTLSFMDGLLYVTCFMQTGWAYTSLLTVLAAVPMALAGSVVIALRGVLLRASDDSCQRSFQGLVEFFHTNRMVQ